MWDLIVPAAGAILGSAFTSRSSRKNTRETLNTNSQLDRENRDWQDANYHRSMRNQLGNDYQDGNVYGGRGTDILGRDRDLDYSIKNMDATFDTLSKRGLTPQEISGSPVPGGVSQSGGNNVLTNVESGASARRAQARQVMAQQMMQSQTQMSTAKIHADAQIKSELIRSGVNLRGQGVQQDTSMYVSDNAVKIGKYNADQISNAQIEAARMYNDTSRHNVISQLKEKSRLNDVKIKEIAANTALIMQSNDIKRVLHSERWEKLFSSMSAENVLASVLAVKNGVNIKDILQNAPVKDRDSLDNFITGTLSSKSIMARESAGTDYYLDTYISPIIKSVSKILDQLYPQN